MLTNKLAFIHLLIALPDDFDGDTIEALQYVIDYHKTKGKEKSKWVKEKDVTIDLQLCTILNQQLIDQIMPIKDAEDSKISGCVGFMEYNGTDWIDTTDTRSPGKL